jgi:hypothetical protein
VGATTADVLWSIGVFVGVPATLFVVLVVRELRRLRLERNAWRDDARGMREEGLAPGAPVESAELDLSVTYTPKRRWYRRAS